MYNITQLTGQSTCFPQARKGRKRIVARAIRKNSDNKEDNKEEDGDHEKENEEGDKDEGNYEYENKGDHENEDKNNDDKAHVGLCTCDEDKDVYDVEYVVEEMLG